MDVDLEPFFHDDEVPAGVITYNGAATDLTIDALATC